MMERYLEQDRVGLPVKYHYFDEQPNGNVYHESGLFGPNGEPMVLNIEKSFKDSVSVAIQKLLDMGYKEIKKTHRTIPFVGK